MLMPRWHAEQRNYFKGKRLVRSYCRKSPDPCPQKQYHSDSHKSDISSSLKLFEPKPRCAGGGMQLELPQTGDQLASGLVPQLTILLYFFGGTFDSGNEAVTAAGKSFDEMGDICRIA